MNNAITQRAPGLPQAAILLVVSSLTVLVTAILGPSLPKMEAHFKNVENVQFLVPMTIPAPMLMMAVFCIAAGALSDRVGRKWLLVWASALYAIVGTAPIYLNSLHAILGSRIGLGLLDAVLMTVSTALIADYWHGNQRERYIALQTTVASLSAFVFNALGGALGELSWRAPFGVYAISLLLVPLMVFKLWDPVKAPDERHTAGNQIGLLAESRSPDVKFRPGMLAIICLLAFLVGIAFMMVPIHFGYLQERIGITSPSQIGFAYGINSLGVLCGTLLFGFVLAQRLQVGMQLFVALIFSSGSLFAMKVAATYFQLTAAGFLNGVACGILLPTMLTWNIRILPSRLRGFGTGAFQSCLFLGFFVNPLIIVAMDKNLGGRQEAVVAYGAVLAVLAMVVIVVSLASATRRRKQINARIL